MSSFNPKLPNAHENIKNNTPMRTIPIKQIDEMQALISRIETFLSHEGAEIKAPDYIEDRITGQLRSVDISIRKKVGSIPVLIIIDCKDENIHDDVEWIEKLAQKRDDIRAGKAVAVSYDGFSDNALKKAKFINIETRLLSEVSVSDLSNWCKVDTMTLFNYRVEYIKIDIFVDTSPEIYTEVQTFLNSIYKNGKFETDAKIFTAKHSKEIFDINKIWEGMLSKHRDECYKGAEANGLKIRRTFIPNFPDSKGKLQLIIDNKTIEIKELELICDIWIEKTEIPSYMANRYASEDTDLVDSVGWEFDVDGKKHIFNVHRDLQSGKMFITGNNISNISMVFQQKDE